MASASSRSRQLLKENDPQRYQEYLNQQRERSRRNRELKKQKWGNEPHTRNTIQERERQLQLARVRQRRYEEKRRQSSGRPKRHRLNNTTDGPAKKRPKDMTPEEYREHRRQLKENSRKRMLPQKKRRVREKDKLYHREKRLGEKLSKQMSAPLTTPIQQERTTRPQDHVSCPESSTCAPDIADLSNSVLTDANRLSKSYYNLVSEVRQKLVRKAKTPRQYARMIRNMAMNTRSPRKKRALAEEGLFQSNLSSSPKIKKALFISPRRKKRRDCLSQKDINSVECFFKREDISRVLPNKRYARKEGPGHVMQHTLKGAYKMLKAEHPDLKVSYSLFTRLRPKNVRKISSVFSESCLCVYCLNVQLKLQAINRTIAAQGLSAELKIANEDALMRLLLCPKEADSVFHRPSCVNSHCDQCCCIRSTLEHHLLPLLDINPVVTWSRWCRITRNGRSLREPKTSQGTVRDLLDEFVESDLRKPALNTTYVKHLFTARWQHYQYRSLKENLKQGDVILIMDFAENRKSSYQDEIKSAHFNKQQITLHPVIAFYWGGQSASLIRHALNFISDDIQHDHHAVHEFTLRTIQFLQLKGVLQPDSKLYIFSDGCAAQYKGKGTFADLTHYSVPVQRIYYGSEHGKGEADGETGVISKALETAVLCRQVCIRDAADLFQWCADNLTKNDAASKRSFFLVPPDAIKRGRQETAVKLIPGCRQFHQVVGIAPFVLKARKLACFCAFCQEGALDHCQNRCYVGQYEVHLLKQTNAQQEGTPTQETDNNCNVMTREDFFHHFQQKLLAAKENQDFTDFVAISSDFDRRRQQYPLPCPPNEPSLCRQQAPPDEIAERQLSTAQRLPGYYPVYTQGYGNCLPLSLSRAVFGHEQFHAELRIRIACELAVHKSEYLSPERIAAYTTLDGEVSRAMYVSLGDYPHRDMETAYELETMDCIQNGKELGPWQLMAAATVLERMVHSFYPNLGSRLVRREVNRVFHPKQTSDNFRIYIQWTSNRTDMAVFEKQNPLLWIANHFVPLIREHEQAAREDVHREPPAPETPAPKIGDFVSVTFSIGRKMIPYHGLVIPVPDYMTVEEGECVVKFLRRCGNYFVFPATDDISIITLNDT